MTGQSNSELKLIVLITFLIYGTECKDDGGEDDSDGDDGGDEDIEDDDNGDNDGSDDDDNGDDDDDGGDDDRDNGDDSCTDDEYLLC
ncbi:hypothetical protein STEG23_008790 [Scotinomys teguina]